MPTPNKDAEHLDALRDYYARNRHIPTFHRVAEILGFASRTASSKLLDRLAAAGFLERSSDNDAWIPTQRFFERPLAEIAVRAGSPDMVEGSAGQPFLVDQYLVSKPATTVMVPVKGDSMSDAGIFDGDVVVVERNRPANPGDFVVARVDGEFTLKELAQERGRYILKPRNPAYFVIRPEGQLDIFGVVTGLVRRYLA